MVVQSESAYRRAVKKYEETLKSRVKPIFDKIAELKETKEAKRRKIKWKRLARSQLARGAQLSSSFVSELIYNYFTGTVNVLLSGKKYSFFNVPEALFNAWKEGVATCSTDDPTGQKRWEIGKNPSLGAFFNDKIKHRRYSYVTGWVE